jgi:hypothetical protein|tara:strand:+ start:568 stop:1230 length:663 start_codon:yes stop_codon:yes gene_type:complete
MNPVVELMLFVAAFVLGVVAIPLLAYSGMKFKLPTRKMLGGLCFTLGNLTHGGSALYQEGNQYRIMPMEKRADIWHIYDSTHREWFSLGGDHTSVIGNRPFGILYDKVNAEPFINLEVKSVDLGITETKGSELLTKPRAGIPGFIPAHYMGDKAKDKTIISLDRLLDRLHAAGGTNQLGQAFNKAIQKHSVKSFDQGYMTILCIACLFAGCVAGYMVMGG